jgi:acyl carrier protein
VVAQRFIPNPFRGDTGARLYRTGDLARYLVDGNLEFLGRIDHQVKIRGFRIELGEIEMVMGRHPAINQVVVVDKEISGDKRLIGYVVPKGDEALNGGELKEFLRKTVPEYMVPSAFVFLQALPLTPNGKLYRKALPDPKEWGECSGGAEDYVSPRTAMEQSIAEVWQEVLGVEPVSAHDNFFDLGGHSLLSLKAITRIEEKTGHRIHPREMILQTLGQIASACEQRASAVREPLSNRPLRRWLMRSDLLTDPVSRAA